MMFPLARIKNGSVQSAVADDVGGHRVGVESAFESKTACEVTIRREIDAVNEDKYC
jgi:hypothetical protein